MIDLHLLLAVIILVLISAFFSGTETGVYRLSRFRLRLGVEQRHSLFGVLDKLMADSQGVIFSVLIGNCLANSLAVSVVTFMLIRSNYSEANAELYATIIMAPALFVFAELIPKNIYFYMADWLMPRLAPIAFVIHRIFVLSGAVGMLKMFARLFAWIAGVPVVSAQAVSAAQRHHIRQIIQETQEEGVLSPVQTQIIERLVNMPATRISSVMIPLLRVRMVPLVFTREDLLHLLKETPFRRLPVYKNDKTNLLGWIDIYETLGSDGDISTLDSFIKPFVPLNADMPIIEALNTMRNNHLEIALIVRTDRRAHSVPLGIVTMKDLVEEIIGELAEW